MYTIYTQNLCGYCTAAKRLMQEHNYKYKEINISENESARRFLKGNGLKTVPQIFVSGIVEDTQIYVGDYTMFKESLNKGKGQYYGTQYNKNKFNR